jgi:pimeloyl-ACP methyl ester carboxylesterase
MPLKKHTETVSGAAIRIHRGGGGPGLVYLHGAGGTANALPFLEKLTDRFDVIAPDLPAFGESEDPAWLETVHDAAYFVLEFLRTLNLSGVHLVGSSLGGWIGLEVAVRSTARLASLTVIGAAGLNVSSARKGDIFMWSPAERLRKMLYDQALADRLLAAVPTAEQTAIAVRNEFATARLAWEPRFFDPHLHKWLHLIDVPTHVIWGAHDNVFPLPYGENLHRRIPGSTLSVIPACGHLPHVEAQGALRNLIVGLAA